jgi:hypothetical protein
VPVSKIAELLEEILRLRSESHLNLFKNQRQKGNDSNKYYRNIRSKTILMTLHED